MSRVVRKILPNNSQSGVENGKPPTCLVLFFEAFDFHLSFQSKYGPETKTPERFSNPYILFISRKETLEVGEYYRRFCGSEHRCRGWRRRLGMKLTGRTEEMKKGAYTLFLVSSSCNRSGGSPRISRDCLALWSWYQYNVSNCAFSK